MKKLLLLFVALLTGISGAWGTTVTYHMIYNGKDVAQYEVDEASATLAIPRALYAAYCTYNSNFYGSASGDDVLDAVAPDIYIRCTGYTGPITFASDVASATYYMLEPGQGYNTNPTNFMYADATNTNYGSGASSVISNFAINDNAKYAFIGTPFSFKVYCKSGYYLACTSTTSDTRLTVDVDVADAAEYILYKNGHNNAKNYTNIVLGVRSNCYGEIGSKGEGTMLTVANTQNAHSSSKIRYWTGSGADFSAGGIVGGLGYAWFCVVPFVTAKYQVVDENKADIVNANAQVPSGVNALDQLLPKSLRRSFCTYSYYSNAACTSPVTNLTSASTVYVTFSCSAPFDFSTEGNPKYYFIYSTEATGGSHYFLKNNSTAYNSSTAISDLTNYYTHSEYQWAFIGNPYSVQLKSKAGGYLATKYKDSKTTGIAVDLEAKITSLDDATYTNNTFSLYGFSSGYITDLISPFSLTLNGSENKSWVDGAKSNKVFYHSNIKAVNADLQQTDWKTLNLNVVDASTYSIRLNSDNTDAYATTYLPFPIKMASGVKAYKAVSTGTNTLILSKVADAAITAEEGDILAAETAAILWKEGATATATIPFDVVTSSKVAPNDNLLGGTVETVSVPDGKDAYVLYGGENGVGFYPLDGTDLPLYKAYYLEDKSLPVKSFSFSFNDIVNGIQKAEMNERLSEGPVYDLSGRRIEKPMQGIYIQNGRKFIIK